MPHSLASAAAVIYAKDVALLQAFYSAVAQMPLATAEDDHVVLAAHGFELVILRIPAAIAETITITSPPQPRSETPIKLVFAVPSLAAVRAEAPRRGGALNPLEREWLFGPWRACDGIDPEGNVFQVRERAAAG